MRAALCFALLQTSLHSHYIPCYRPNPSPGQRPPFCRSLACVEKLVLRRRALRTALCFLPRYRPRYTAVTYLVTDPQTSLHSRYIPRYRPNPSPGQRSPFLPQLGALCVLRFALPRYRPGYIAVTHLGTDPTPARASERPGFMPQLGLR